MGKSLGPCTGPHTEGLPLERLRASLCFLFFLKQASFALGFLQEVFPDPALGLGLGRQGKYWVLAGTVCLLGQCGLLVGAICLLGKREVLAGTICLQGQCRVLACALYLQSQQVGLFIHLHECVPCQGCPGPAAGSQLGRFLGGRWPWLQAGLDASFFVLHGLKDLIVIIGARGRE